MKPAETFEPLATEEQPVKLLDDDRRRELRWEYLTVMRGGMPQPPPEGTREEEIFLHAYDRQVKAHSEDFDD